MPVVGRSVNPLMTMSQGPGSLWRGVTSIGLIARVDERQRRRASLFRPRPAC
jgi:cell division protein FtsW (lipid II flippase)